MMNAYRIAMLAVVALAAVLTFGLVATAGDKTGATGAQPASDTAMSCCKGADKGGDKGDKGGCPVGAEKPGPKAPTENATSATASDELNFTLNNYDGTKVSLSDHADKIVVLEWINAECPYVVRHYKAKTMTDLAAKYKDNGVVWLAINSGKNMNASGDAKWAQEHQIAYPILADHAEGKVGKQYGAKTTPHMFIIQQGKIVYRGGIDNDPNGKLSAEERINYVDKALAELTSGKAVSVPESKPYGCTVKY